MVSPSWNLLYANGPLGGFQNALAQGYALGTDIRQRREEGERRNALAAYGQDPNDQTLAGVMTTDPMTGMALRQQQQQREASAAAERQQQAGIMRRLLNAAGENPMQAFQAAQGMNLDLSGVPDPSSPEFEPWRQNQMFIYGALENINDQELTTLQQNVMAALPPQNRNPNDPMFIQAMQRALIDWQTVQPGGQISGQNPISGQVENMAMPGYGPQAAPQPSAGPPSLGNSVGMDQWRDAVTRYGSPEAAASVYTSQGIAVRVTSPEEASQFPSGTLFLAPGENTPRTVN